MCRIGHDDPVLGQAVKHHKVAQSFLGPDVGDGWQRYLGQGLVEPLDRLGREAEVLSGLDEPEQVGPGPVCAGQLAHLLQSNGPSVVERHRRQRRCTAIHHITLPDASISLQHAVSSSNSGF
jgi:hypothetical protein